MPGEHLLGLPLDVAGEGVPQRDYDSLPLVERQAAKNAHVFEYLLNAPEKLDGA